MLIGLKLKGRPKIGKVALSLRPIALALRVTKYPAKPLCLLFGAQQWFYSATFQAKGVRPRAFDA